MLEFQMLDAASDDFHILVRLYRHKLHMTRSELAKALALSCDVVTAYEAPPVSHARPDEEQLEMMNCFLRKTSRCFGPKSRRQDHLMDERSLNFD